MYDTKLFFVVQSKFPEILAEFKQTFLPTTTKFTNLHLCVEDDEEYGAVLLNKRILDARAEGASYFACFNDDMWFADGWLESVLEFLLSGKHWCVSPGYVETDKMEVFKKAVELTKNETGFVNHLYGANEIFNMNTFRKYGCYDEQFGFYCEDLDWALRFKLWGIPSITLKKITTAHWVRATKKKSSLSESNAKAEISKAKFATKWGYEAYRLIRSEYKVHHRYFTQFK